MILDALHRIANHRQSLSREEAQAVMTEILTGEDAYAAHFASVVFTFSSKPSGVKGLTT